MTFHFTGGLPETECGYGSTLGCTEHLRMRLPGLLRMLAVRRLLDAPCGDGNWIAAVDMPDVDYVGIDIEARHLLKAVRRMYHAKSATFRDGDVLTMLLPEADAMLCRDFMQHLPDLQVYRVLDNFLSSGIPWLLATSHGNDVNADIERSGMFRPLNLMESPFNFPQPSVSASDPPNTGRMLGAWHRDAVRRAVK